MPTISSPTWATRLSDTALRKRSGAAVFARGQAYAAGGAIDTLEDALPRAGEQCAQTATVQGTRAYQVRVWIDQAGALEGACTCPHARDGHFCKHLVAVCLGWRAQLQGTASIPDQVASASKSARTRAHTRNALQRFVKAQSAEDLAARLWAWAGRNRDLMAELVAWQAERNAGSNTQALRRAISDMLRVRGFLDWHDMPAYTERVTRVLALLEPWLKRDPQALRELCGHTLDGLHTVMEQADDSDGELHAVMEDIMALLIQSLHAAPPPAAWVDHWFQRMQDDPWGVWNDRAILAAIGAAAQARYAERARADWMQWLREHPATHKSGQPGKRADYHDDTRRRQLRRRWLDGIALQGDPRALLDAMTSQIDSAAEFHDIVELCEAHDWHLEARQWAQTAVQQYPDDWRVQDDLLRCYARDGSHEDALKLWRHRLTQRPTPDHYRATLDAAVQAGHDHTIYRTQLHAWAEQEETRELAAQRQHRSRWQTPQAPVRDVSLRISWLLADKDMDAALNLMQQEGVACRYTLLETLARKLPARHHPIAAQWLRRILYAHMETATSPYAKPLELVRAISKRLPAGERRQWLSDLRTRYQRKRNFIAGLP